VSSFSSGTVTVPGLLLAATITFGGAVFVGESIRVLSTFHTTSDENDGIDQHSSLNMPKYLFTVSGATSCRERSRTDAFWTVNPVSWRSTKQSIHRRSAVINF
jgi:hypothetical protein